MMGHAIRIVRHHGVHELVRALHRGYVHRFLPEKTRFLPSAMEVEITTLCNLECIMCRGDPGFRGKGSPKQMSLERYSLLLERLCFLKDISFRGAGEPAMHPDLVELARRTVRSGKKIRIFTNGMTMDRELGQALVSVPVQEIVFSIDACRQGTYAAVRKGGDLERVLDNLDAVGELVKGVKGIRLSVMFVVMRSNFREFEGLLKRIDGKGVSMLVPKTLYAGEKSVACEEILSDDETARFRAILEAATSGETKVLRECESRVEQNQGRIGCKKIWESPFVTVDGDLSLCPASVYKDDIVYGNIFDQGFLSIWNSPLIVRHRRMIVRGENPLCNACPSMHAKPF